MGSYYPLICIAFLVICSFSIIETGSATRSGPTPKPDSLIHVESEPVTPPRTSNNNKGLKESMAQVVGPANPNYYPYSGPGSPYYGQPYFPNYGQPYFPNYGIPTVFPTIGGPLSGPYSYPYSSYNPTLPYPNGPGSNIYGPPSNGDARDSSKARRP